MIPPRTARNEPSRDGMLIAPRTQPAYNETEPGRKRRAPLRAPHDWQEC